MSASKSLSGKLLARSLDDVGHNMFVPEHFDFSNTHELIAYVQQNPFAQLFSSFNDQLQITATPLIYTDRPANARDTTSTNNGQDKTTHHQFVGHIAKRNPHCAAIRAGVQAIALLQGPDAYISPRWYAQEPKIPTWSYIAVQLQGHFTAIEDHDETLDVLAKTISHMEQHETKPWRLEDTSPDLLAQFSQGILAFRFEATVIEGIKRLGQNRDLEDMEKVMQGLNDTKKANAQIIAALMQQNIDKAT